jgi:hypothetical protein
MTEQEAQADLEAKVRDLFKPLMQSVMESLNRLRLSGSGIVQDHMRNECNYLVPKAFMSAVLEEKGQRFKGFTKESKELKRNYLELL